MPAGAMQTVTWSVSPSGSVSATGLFTAPMVSANQMFTVTATSMADAVKSGSFVVQVNATAPAAPTGVTVTCQTPVVSGATSQCNAVVAPTGSSQAVTWTASGGTITQTGLLTAPSETVTTNIMVTAAAGSVSGMFQVQVNPSTAPPPSATGPENLGAGSYPSAAVDSTGVINIAWFTEAGIAFAQSQNQGVTFNIPVVVVPAPAFEPSIAVDGQSDILILTGNNPTNTLGKDIAVVAHSTDGGKTFTAVTAQQNTYESLLLVQPSGVVDLAYTTSDDNEVDPDNALHEKRSTDGGNTFTNDQTLWTAPINVSDIQQMRGALGPQGQIYYSWTEQVDLNCEVHFVNSLDGLTFQPSVLLTNNDDCNRDGALVVDAAGNIDATWATGGTDFARSTDQGQTFTTPTLVPIGEEAGQLAVGPNGALNSVVDGQSLTFTQSLDNGVTWSAPVSLGLSGAPANFMGPQDAQIAVDPSGKITVAWRDDTNGTFAGDYDVYISTSTDGKNFTPATNISKAAGAFTSAPTVLIAPQGLRYIYWYETSNTNAADVNVFFYAVQ